MTRLGIALSAIAGDSWDERLVWARDNGLSAIEILATGEPWGLHTPHVAPEDRPAWRERFAEFESVSLLAPSQATFDVTLVSPSSAIRRASLSELWSVCRFARETGASQVLVRCGSSPAGVAEAQMVTFLGESIKVLDKTAQDQGVTVCLLNRDWFSKLENYGRLKLEQLPATRIALDMTFGIGADFEAFDGFLERHGEQVACVRVPLKEPLLLGEKPETNPGDLFLPQLRQGSFAGNVLLTSATPLATEDLLLAVEEWRRFL